MRESKKVTENDYSKCQYCFNDYDQCTCCKFCSVPLGKCECPIENGVLILHPSNIYKALFSKDKSRVCIAFAECIGLFSGEEVDRYIMDMYTKEVWPERLKPRRKSE